MEKETCSNSSSLSLFPFFSFSLSPFSLLLSFLLLSFFLSLLFFVFKKKERKKKKRKDTGIEIEIFKKERREARREKKIAHKKRLREEGKSANKTKAFLRYNREKRREELSLVNYHFVIDCGFSSIMSDRELSSLCVQLGVLYGYNVRNTKNPFFIHLIGLDPLKNPLLPLMKHHFPNFEKTWVGAEFETKGIEDLYESWKGEEGGKKKIVYLSPDADEILPSVQEGVYYCVGGLVDKQRKKGTSLQKARDMGMPCYRIPAIQSLILADNCLTLNEVLEFLSLRREYSDWEGVIKNSQRSKNPKKFRLREKEGKEKKKGEKGEEREEKGEEEKEKEKSE